SVVRLARAFRASFQFPGDQTARVTPVPIPNTEVKPRRADDTARVTVWERRSPPGLILEAVLSNQSGLFVFALTRRSQKETGIFINVGDKNPVESSKVFAKVLLTRLAPRSILGTP